jgi:cell division protein FtsW
MTAARPRPNPRPATSAGSWDYALIALVSVLLALGLALVFSASYPYRGTDFFIRQAIWIVIGIVAAFMMARIPYSVWRRLALPVIILALGMLVAVLVVGEERGGATRTFFGSIQPGEFAKLAVVVYIAAWAASKGRRLADMQEGLIPFILIMGTVTVLLALEPSYSVAAIVLIIGVAIFFVAGGDVRQMLLLCVLAAPAIGLALWRSRYPIERIQRWIDGLRTPGQLASDTVAVWQKQTFGPENMVDRIAGVSPIPLAWSDYLYAFIADKLGFIGALVIVVLYAALAYRLLAIALNAPDRFGTFMAVGITAWIVAQALIHIGASTALLPETGQPLPLMSYGGSDMLACMLAVGMMQSISRASPAKKALYANLALGGWNRRPRIPNSDRGGRVKATHQRSQSSGSTPDRVAPGAGRQRRSAASPAYGHETRAVNGDELDGKPAWRRASSTTERKSRGSAARKSTPRRR